MATRPPHPHPPPRNSPNPQTPNADALSMAAGKLAREQVTHKADFQW